jgi:hypothetical protein
MRDEPSESKVRHAKSTLGVAAKAVKRHDLLVFS